VGEEARADRQSALRVERKPRGLSTVVTAPVWAHRSVIRRPRPVGRTRRSTVRWALVLADFLGLTTAAASAYLLTHGGIGYDPLLFAIPAWAVLASFYGLYKRDRVGADNATLDEVWPIFNCVTVASFAVFATVQAVAPSSLHGGRVVAFWALAALAIPAYRSIARTLLRRQLALKQRAVVVGAGLVGQEIARKVLRQPSYGLDLVGFVDPNPLQLHDELEHLPVLGSTDDLAEILATNDIDHVVLAFTADHQAGLDVVRVCNEMGVQVDIVPRLFEVVGSRAAVYSLEGTPLLGLTPPVLGASHRLAKRAMDIIGAVFGLVVLSPLFLACAIAIRLNSDGPIFFRQVRIGRGQKPFTIIKFRTMVADAEERKAEVAHLNAHFGLGDARMFKIPDDPRQTSIGRFLRKYSIDEFPQLWNVLMGQMSLVGPRPLIPTEHQFVNDWGLRRLDLTPGLTGLWQVCGRSEVTFSQMLVLDYLYVTNWSLWGDIKLILRTVPALMGKTRGAS
jgi:exopolysaccharide biosynthesis polyprenyl glycosylphosphotransferase